MSPSKGKGILNILRSSSGESILDDSGGPSTLLRVLVSGRTWASQRRLKDRSRCGRDELCKGRAGWEPRMRQLLETGKGKKWVLPRASRSQSRQPLDLRQRTPALGEKGAASLHRLVVNVTQQGTLPTCPLPFSTARDHPPWVCPRPHPAHPLCSFVLESLCFPLGPHPCPLTVRASGLWGRTCSRLSASLRDHSFQVSVGHLLRGVGSQSAFSGVKVMWLGEWEGFGRQRQRANPYSLPFWGQSKPLGPQERTSWCPGHWDWHCSSPSPCLQPLRPAASCTYRPAT